jgi:hypothetical protein
MPQCSKELRLTDRASVIWAHSDEPDAPGSVEGTRRIKRAGMNRLLKDEPGTQG